MEMLEEKKQLNDNIEVARLFLQVLGLFKHSIGNVFEETGITGPQAMVMGILDEQKKMKITELSNKISLSNSTVSGIIDRLEKQGMVERERSKEDRRVVYVSICPKFSAEHKNIHKLIQENTANIIKMDTPEEMDKIFEGLSTLKRILGEQ